MRSLLKSLCLNAASLMCRDVGPKVIYYHDIFSETRYTDMGTSIELVRRHFEVARDAGFRFVSGRATQDRELQIVLDDGFRGVWDVREFFLRQKALPTICLIVGFIGRDGYLTWDQVLELNRMGFRFAAHTWNHRSLTDGLSTAEFDCELTKAREVLSNRLGVEVVEFCFPRGKFSDDAVAQCRASGFKALYTSLPGTVGKFPLRRFDSVDVEMIPRNLAQCASVTEFGGILRGGPGLFWRHYAKMHDRSDYHE